MLCAPAKQVSYALSSYPPSADGGRHLCARRAVRACASCSLLCCAVLCWGCHFGDCTPSAVVHSRKEGYHSVGLAEASGFGFAPDAPQFCGASRFPNLPAGTAQAVQLPWCITTNMPYNQYCSGERASYCFLLLWYRVQACRKLNCCTQVFFLFTEPLITGHSRPAQQV